MKFIRIFLGLLLLPLVLQATNPVSALLERLQKGASKHFVIEKVKSNQDFFELDSRGNKIVVRGLSLIHI